MNHRPLSLPFLTGMLLLTLASACQERDASAGAAADPAAKGAPSTALDLEKSRIDTTRIMLASVQQALDIFKVQNGAYPTIEQGLKELLVKEILARMPRDGWGRAIEYTLKGPNSYTLKSYGADGAPGGEGANADIVVER